MVWRCTKAIVSIMGTMVEGGAGALGLSLDLILLCDGES